LTRSKSNTSNHNDGLEYFLTETRKISSYGANTRFAPKKYQIFGATMDFSYVGDSKILADVDFGAPREHIQNKQDLIKLESKDKITWATYIVDLENRLWLADRRSEHVACARGKAVLAAGEMAWQTEKNTVEIVEITNQSTGYCPTPESWGVVSAVLDRLDIVFPSSWTRVFLFRRCPCGQINTVKDGVFECAVCGQELSLYWNF
jgi:hypothetical protein